MFEEEVAMRVENMCKVNPSTSRPDPSTATGQVGLGLLRVNFPS
jgi:hypothetical protein